MRLKGFGVTIKAKVRKNQQWRTSGPKYSCKFINDFISRVQPRYELVLKPAAQISKNSETTCGSQTPSRPNFTPPPPLAYTPIFRVTICPNWDLSESKRKLYKRLCENSRHTLGLSQANQEV